VLDGRWASVPGVLHADWQLVVTTVGQRPAVALVPLADLRVVDGPDAVDVTGAGGAGVVADAVFVPANLVAPLSTVAGESLAGVTAASWAGAVVGLAKDARDWYLDGLVTDHGPSFAGGPASAPAAMSHAQASNAFTVLTMAERCANQLASTVDAGLAVSPGAVEEVCRLAGDAVHILAAVSGPSSPVHRIARDLAAVTGHLLAEADTEFGDLAAAGRPSPVDRPESPPPSRRKEIR